MATGDDMNGILTELAGLRTQMEVGFARIAGQLDLLVYTQGQFREELADVEAALGDVEKRVSALEARRWPTGQMAMMSGVVGAVATVATMLVR